MIFYLRLVSDEEEMNDACVNSVVYRLYVYSRFIVVSRSKQPNRNAFSLGHSSNKRGVRLLGFIQVRGTG